ncbi:MAG: T9SS type A sorting domain-containing protein [Flavobacterium sp.]|nr:T9SS type A sorting domain-containing protein [Flavobacterium sp.]
MKLKNKLLGILFVILAFQSNAQSLNITGSCVDSTGSLTQGGDVANTSYNGRPVYYNGALAINLEGTATTTVAYLYYALGTEIGTLENRWVVSYDGQPYYSFISDATAAPGGQYDPFDTNLTTTQCGSFVTIAVPCVDPTAYTVTGGGSYCSGGAGMPIGLSSSELGVTYALTDGNGVAISIPTQSGTGAAINFGNLTQAGTYRVFATRDGGSCPSVSMTDSVSIQIIENPTALAGGAMSAICQGGTSAALNGSFGGSATGAIWSDGGAGGTFTNNDGLTPATTTYTAALNAPSSVTLTLTSTGGSCGVVTDSKSITVNAGTLYYVDADGDGFTSNSPQVLSCTQLSGYVLTSSGVDCNDSNAAVNPNASEVLANGIDDNCDGTTDEATPTSNLLAQSCNVVLPLIQTSLFCEPLINAFAQLGTIQGFRFKVTNGATVRTYDSLTNSFNLTLLPGGATLGTNYTVEVSAKSGGYWRAYGSLCTVTTPSAPRTTYVSNPVCGSTLTDISQSIFCEVRPSVSGYRFRVRNGATVVGTVDKIVNRFSLVDLGISNIAFGTTYTVDVLLAFGGIFRPDTEYGSACSISTPATPGTSRVIAPSCGSSINNLWTTIYAQQVLGAQGYKFVVTNGAQTREYPTANPRFQLPLLSGGAAASTAYTIRVDVLYNLSYVQGTVLCTITTSPTATRQTSSALAIYEVNAYPNPYAETFKLNVNTSSEDQVGVRVYDMLGREVEARQASVAAITNLEIGSQYPSGVYNIIVTQGANVKTVRVIKR